MRKSGLLQLTTVLLAALSVNGLALAADTGAIGEPGRESGKPNPLKNVYFGEQHMHTRNSFDAFTFLPAVAPGVQLKTAGVGLKLLGPTLTSVLLNMRAYQK